MEVAGLHAAMQQESASMKIVDAGLKAHGGRRFVVCVEWQSGQLDQSPISGNIFNLMLADLEWGESLPGAHCYKRKGAVSRSLSGLNESNRSRFQRGNFTPRRTMVKSVPLSAAK
jgi:hypothetical protein